jgi:cytochrome b subunit of formate dehydrogenase
MARWNLRKAVGWLLLAFSLLLVITGLGITEWRTVEAASFGLLPKALASRLHSLLWIPFLAVLAGHLALSCLAGKRGKE